MEWQERARCAEPDIDPELFFAADGETWAQSKARVTAAKRICFACEVREQCDVEARRSEDAFGVLGGLTPKERGAKWHMPVDHGYRYGSGCRCTPCVTQKAVYDRMRNERLAGAAS